MELQSPQSVQINFNNKIITLHNVTLLKNPKIITIDAKHYSNLLKGSPNGKVNGSGKIAVTTPINLQMPSLVPMKKLSSTQAISFRVNQPTPVIKEVPSIVTKNGAFQLKTTTMVPSLTTSNGAVKLQAFPIKHQPTVIISPPKATTASTPVPEMKPKVLISNNQIKPLTSTPAKVIISPPQKNKLSPCVLKPPETKKPCKKLQFHCIFPECKEIFDESNLLVEHMKLQHTESVRLPVLNDEVQVKVENKIVEEKVVPVRSRSSSDDDDDDEINDLVMHLEDGTTQDTAEPDSPEFEAHVPQSPASGKEKSFVKDEPTSSDEDCEDLLESDFEYFSSIMEPICELSCGDDSKDGIQDENEAMRLYREAMEVNYQQNGIKKRGRRKQRKAKPLIENTTTLNGILAGLLENASIKVPVGPGRGRRKEMNEQELEIERSSGVCLFSCNKCDLTFKFAGDLAKHVRSHTISSPYQVTSFEYEFENINLSFSVHDLPKKIHSHRISKHASSNSFWRETLQMQSMREKFHAKQLSDGSCEVASLQQALPM